MPAPIRKIYIGLETTDGTTPKPQLYNIMFTAQPQPKQPKTPLWKYLLWRLVYVVGLYGAMTIVMMINLVYRFRHPSLTETQLFLANWHWYLVALVGFLIEWRVYPIQKRYLERWRR